MASSRAPAQLGSRTKQGGAPAGAVPAELDRGVRGAWLVIRALALVGCLHCLFMLGVETYRAVTASAAIARLEADVAALEAEAAQLQAIVDHADDERYREQLARKQGFIYPDEVRVVSGPRP